MSTQISISYRDRVAIAASVTLVAMLAWWLWPRESRRVANVIRTVEHAAEAGDWQAVMREFSPRYHHDGVSYADLVGWAPRISGQVGDLAIYVLRKRIRVQGNAATATLNLVATSSGRNARFSGTDRSSWQLSFRKQNGRWLIHKMTPVDVGSRWNRASSLRDIKRWLDR